MLDRAEGKFLCFNEPDLAFALVCWLVHWGKMWFINGKSSLEMDLFHDFFETSPCGCMLPVLFLSAKHGIIG